jgi:hypothetical protein
LSSPKSRIFVIGLSRTGTTSMMAALEYLGYKCLHYPDTEDVMRKTLKGKFDWDVLDEYNAFADGAVAAFYKQLDKQCPGSKFILLVREEAAWLSSCKKKINPVRAKALDVEASWGNAFSLVVRACLYNVHYFDEKAFLVARERHTEDVLRYFRKRKGDLLVMDIKEGWKPLCEFLEVPVPSEEFPHYTKAPKRRFK